jgi:hypothetical protein
VLERATYTANALADVIDKRNLYSVIKGNKHVQVEGWQTLGSMLGVTPICVWTRPLDNGWEARVEARTLDGRLIGAAEAMCLKAEARWRSADDYAIRSMAQTRATSKALASPLRFVITLAGYAGTPAEEMTFEESPVEPPPELTPPQRLQALIVQHEIAADAVELIRGWVSVKGALDPDRVDKAIKYLEDGAVEQLLREAS